jgi:hypothetical protein
MFGSRVPMKRDESGQRFIVLARLTDGESYSAISPVSTYFRLDS